VILCSRCNLIVLERRKALESESVSIQLEKLIDLAHDAIIVRDVDSVILKWNAGATATYGWTEAEAIGQVTHTFFRTRFPPPPLGSESRFRSLSEANVIGVACGD
jgi:PAS domain-containing protein